MVDGDGRVGEGKSKVTSREKSVRQGVDKIIDLQYASRKSFRSVLLPCRSVHIPYAFLVTVLFTVPCAMRFAISVLNSN